MKNLKTKSILKLAALFIVIITMESCGNEDSISPPAIDYPTIGIEATFFTEGQSEIPTVDWNGDEGAFTFSPSIKGLSIDATTGQLSWSNLLPTGIHNIEVIATNKKGEAKTEITIDNPLQGVFVGTFNESQYFRFEFFKNGTINVSIDENINDQATGIWQLDGDEVTSDYTYLNNDNFQYSIKGILTHNSNEVVLEGDWYVGHGTVPGSDVGSFSVTMN